VDIPRREYLRQRGGRHGPLLTRITHQGEEPISVDFLLVRNGNALFGVGV
jgi:hypothetical protein